MENFTWEMMQYRFYLFIVENEWLKAYYTVQYAYKFSLSKDRLF